MYFFLEPRKIKQPKKVVPSIKPKLQLKTKKGRSVAKLAEEYGLKFKLFTTLKNQQKKSCRNLREFSTADPYNERA